MEHEKFIAAIHQLSAAAELLAKDAAEDDRMGAFKLLAFFRMFERTGRPLEVPEISDDELFRSTAEASLAMVGRRELAACRALLEQARSLLPAS